MTESRVIFLGWISMAIGVGLPVGIVIRLAWHFIPALL